MLYLPAMRIIDPATGNVISSRNYEPFVEQLRQPRASTATIGIERQILPGLDEQVSFTNRQSSRLAASRDQASSAKMATSFAQRPEASTASA